MSNFLRPIWHEVLLGGDGLGQLREPKPPVFTHVICIYEIQVDFELGAFDTSSKWIGSARSALLASVLPRLFAFSRDGVDPESPFFLVRCRILCDLGLDDFKSLDFLVRG